jgi:hypothetical protein
MTFIPDRLQRFLSIPFAHQPFSYAKAPQSWVASLQLDGAVFDAELPAIAQTREEVRSLCRDNRLDLMYRYICAMAWGNQGPGLRHRHAIAAWAQRDRLRPILARVYAGDLDRAEAYTLFCGQGMILGLGPSYFTKLLYFFSPIETFYIMDQWTAKSINYLCKERVVPMAGDNVATRKDGDHYELYCRAVETLAAMTRETEDLSGAQTEMRLFCHGGRPPGAWRKIIQDGYLERILATN